MILAISGPVWTPIRNRTGSPVSAATPAATSHPALLRDATNHYVAEMGIEGPDELMMFEALFAGWSEAAGTMRVTSRTMQPGFRSTRSALR